MQVDAEVEEGEESVEKAESSKCAHHALGNYTGKGEMKQEGVALRK
jgi:hypothetical protein